MAHAWKACWCNSLAGSNPVLSARKLTIGPDLSGRSFLKSLFCRARRGGSGSLSPTVRYSGVEFLTKGSFL